MEGKHVVVYMKTFSNVFLAKVESRYDALGEQEHSRLTRCMAIFWIALSRCNLHMFEHSHFS